MRTKSELILTEMWHSVNLLLQQIKAWMRVDLTRDLARNRCNQIL